MLIPKKTRNTVYRHLFAEGVMCAKDDANAPHHHELKSIPNLHVMKLLQSLASRGLCTVRYNWRWYYYILTNEGVAYLREYLGTLPENVTPKTHVKQAGRPQTGARPEGERGRFGDRERGERREGGGRFERREGGDRDRNEFRRGPPREGGRGFSGGFAGKEGGAPGGDAQPQFRSAAGRGGFGRGRGAPRE
jgi:small subunit ribosomal protein S10e